MVWLLYVRSLLHGVICVTKCQRPPKCFSFVCSFFLLLATFWSTIALLSSEKLPIRSWWNITCVLIFNVTLNMIRRALPKQSRTCLFFHSKDTKLTSNLRQAVMSQRLKITFYTECHSKLIISLWVHQSLSFSTLALKRPTFMGTRVNGEDNINLLHSGLMFLYHTENSTVMLFIQH